MDTMKYMRLFFMSFITCSLIWFIGCATTGSTTQQETEVESVADIDELLGLTDTKARTTEEETIAEDDVLRLLGVTEETKPATNQQTATDRSSIESKIQQLESEQEVLQAQESSLAGTTAQRESVSSSGQQGTTQSTTQSRESVEPVLQATTFTDRYNIALKEYNSRNYREAIQQFEDLLTVNSRHTLSDNCQYWIGECYYGLGQYQQAIVSFEKVFSFSNSNKDADAQLKLGLCYARLNDNERAIREFQKLIDNYPTSEYVSQANRYISELQ
ncbi:tetratricopeptide repeat protein [bacterium]|nr:tetratricopeptide repeat protein [bacterium]